MRSLLETNDLKKHQKFALYQGKKRFAVYRKRRKEHDIWKQFYRFRWLSSRNDKQLFVKIVYFVFSKSTGMKTHLPYIDMNSSFVYFF